MRRKSNHFAAYDDVAKEFAGLLSIDPWLVNPYFAVCGEVNFQERAGEECLSSNVEALLAIWRDAKDADLVVTPELSVTGYPPEDLLLRPALYARARSALAGLAATLARFPGLPVVVGHPSLETLAPAPEQRYNCASVLVDGRIAHTYRKHDLPNYEVFDEVRYFAPSGHPCVFEVKGIRFGLNICEDVWYAYAPDAARRAGAQVLLVPNGSPYHIDKAPQRVEIVRARIEETGMPIVYANLVGGQDELQFDGDSFVLDGFGIEQARLPHCEECVEVVEFESVGHAEETRIHVHRGHLAPALEREEAVYRVLVQGVRDYLGKNGFPGAIIGLSGGIDSALVLAIAVDALGADRVRAVMMPSPYTSRDSLDDAAEVAAAFTRLLDDPDLRRRMGAAGRERAVAEFSYDVLAHRLGIALGALAP